MTSGENFKKEREAKSKFRRPKASRTPNTRTLILTEGEKTEPSYFKQLCNYLGINGVSINENSEGVAYKAGLAPKSIAEIAKKEAKAKEGKGKNSYYWSEIYCVFDRDRHETFQYALNELHQLQGKHESRTITAIVSDICFELWYLLHFAYTTRQFDSCSEVIQELEKVKVSKKTPFKAYQKGKTDYFDILKTNIKDAFLNAQNLKTERTKVNAGPYTDIPIIIETLYKKAPQTLKNEFDTWIVAKPTQKN